MILQIKFFEIENLFKKKKRKKVLPRILRALSCENACTRLELSTENSPVFPRHCTP